MFRFENVKFKDIVNIPELVLEDHKVISIIGPSGSGKTTILKLLNKMYSPDSGKVYYDGKDIEAIPSTTLRRNVVMLAQSPVVFKGNIRDNLNIGLKFSGKDNKSDDELKKIMHFISLDKNLDEKPDNLSGGEKQRLSLGRILLMNPEVFLLDEPSSALDNDLAESIVDGVVRYSKEKNKTVIMVTHTLELAKLHSDIIVSVNSGKIESIKKRGEF